MSVNSVMSRLRAKVDDDPALLATLELLADAGTDDPFAEVPPVARRLAREVNVMRHQQRRADLQSRSLTTREVVELVGSISDRKGVDRRRQRGTLLGVHGVARQVLHPDWQFDLTRGETHAGLPEVLVALAEVTSDPVHADALATADQPRSGGVSIAGLLAAGQVADAVAMARLAGDQS